VVQPTVELAKRNSKQRIDPLIEESDVLRELVKSPRSRDSGNTVLSKKFPGGVLVMTGANSAVGLRSMAVRYLFLDEIDAYPGDVDGEGDPINLAFARTRTFSRRKVFMVSTPLVAGWSRIEAAYAESDQRRYWVPCPHCGKFQVLRWDNLVWPKGEPGKAEYRCEHCAKLIGDWQKHWMLKHGEWRAAHPEREVASFWINGLYSPWRKWSALATKFLADRRSPETLREFVNTVLAEPWDDEAETSVDIATVMARREALPGASAVRRGGAHSGRRRAEGPPRARTGRLGARRGVLVHRVPRSAG